MNWNPVEYNTGEDARYGMAGQPGMDQMQMHRGAGFTIPDNIRADIILKDQEGWEVEEIIEMGYPSDVVSQVLVESKVEGRNPAGPTPTMKFPQGKELAGTYPTSPSGDIAKSFENAAPQPKMQMPMQGIMNPPPQQPPQDPRMMDIMNPRFNRY